MTYLVLGGTGMVGSAVSRALTKNSIAHLAIGSATLDLTHRDKTFAFIREMQPSVVIDAAALSGGINANNSNPVDFISRNLQIQTNVFDACHAANVERLVFLGSSCIYPRDCAQPIKEEYLMSGRLEETNSAYAVAKIAGIEAVRAYRKQFARKWISLMPTNLYGPGDNFDPQTSHVIPGMINKFQSAIINNQLSVELWGSGTPKREFMHVDDLARGILFALENYNDDLHLNVGTGKDISIKDLAQLISNIMNFKGDIIWNTLFPDGTPRKTLDISKFKALGWQPQISLEQGLTSVIEWYLDNLETKSEQMGIH